MSRVTAKDDKTLPPAKLAMYEYLTVEGVSRRNIDMKLLKRVVIYTAVTLVLFIFVATGFQYISNSQVSANAVFVDEVQNYTDKLSKLTILPKETPTIDIVDDVTKFQQYSFNSDLQEGDVILSFKNAQKYYAYREVNLLVGIHLGPLISVPITEVSQASSSDSSSSSSGASSTPRFIVKILNGSTLSGIGTELQTKVLSKFPNEVKISSVETAKNRTYKSNKLIIINDKAKEVAEKIAAEYNCEIIDMPTGEASMGSADILIITGRQ